MGNPTHNKRIALVTGGTRGIGKSIATLFIKNGYTLYYTGTSSFPKEQIQGGIYKQLELEDKKSLENFCTFIELDLPQIDILINNAGINIVEAVNIIEDTSWEEVIGVNLTAAMKITRAVSNKMIESGLGGKILNISSIFGVVSKKERATYSASKAGLIGFTKAVSLDLAKHNILVNALCPGFTLTDLPKSILSEEERNDISADIPLGRFADPDEIAQAAYFLCSDVNTYITGQALIVDGGFTIK